MRTYLFIWFLLIAFVANGQIIPEEKNPFPTNEFVVYAEHADSVNHIYYQVGRHEPKNYTHHILAPLYLKVKRQKEESYYFLNSYYDPDMFSFPPLTSDNLTIIAGRYDFYLYDIHNHTLSDKQTPGLHQYEGEDAISGLYSALTLFDNEHFLLGNVQGFGIFCFDISDPANPSELVQYNIKKPNGEQFYAFFHQTDYNLFDIIIAQQDTSSESRNIKRHYRKLRNVRYAMQHIAIDMDDAIF
ncbi:MAG TPA: hypothetical protein VKZ57_06610 [Sphingobacterium sp.]|nr:hypothetical protein [Sphingobacterium sp.]